LKKLPELCGEDEEMTRVFNAKNNTWWSWTFSSKWAAEAAIKCGHYHDTSHLEAVDEYEEEYYER
jgi:hypothetical protein